ncbi:MAG: glycosyltransferase family 39 protein [Nitrososphaerota archaeon]|nr:glycosyltransferase family 39 protein [Nitrososphaerota archaeon]
MTGLPVEFYPGYATYLAAILLPGYGFWEALGKWKDDDTLADRLGLSFGVGIAVDTVVFAVKTMGLGVPALLGAGTWVDYFLIFLGLAALGASYVRRRRFTRPPSFTRNDFVVILLAAFMAAVTALYFAKFPFFPYFSQDFLVHTAEATGLIQGTQATVPNLLIYGAADYQLGMALLAVGGLSLVTVRHTMDVLLVLSPFLVYAVARKLFSGSRAALFAAAIYALSGTLWSTMVLYTGLYANFVGVLLELLLVVAFLDLASGYRSASIWLSSGTIVVAGYLSHYTVLSLFGGFLIFALAARLSRRPGSRGYLLASAAFLAPGALGAILFQSWLLQVLSSSYVYLGRPPLTTFLSQLLGAVPAVAYIASDLGNDPGFVALFALLGVALYWAYRSRHLPTFLMAAWLVGLIAASPENGGAWRFAFEAIVPVILLAGYGLDSLLSHPPSPAHAKKMRLPAPGSANLRRVGMVAVCLLFLVPIAAQGQAAGTANSSTRGTQLEAQVQGALFQAMAWLDQNTPPTSTVLSVTDPRFIFARVVIDRIASDYYSPTASGAIAYATLHGERYIVVTRHDVVTTNGTSVSDTNDTTLPWFTYPLQSGLTMVYNNTDVMIFEISAGA